MANFTEERLREMEDEMDRFEMEIMTAKIPQAPEVKVSSSTEQGPRIIGAGTYRQMQAHIDGASMAGPNIPSTMQGGPSYGPAYPPQSSAQYGIRPPPPPPAFRPPQLRSRPMPPPRPPFPRPPAFGGSMPGMYPPAAPPGAFGMAGGPPGYGRPGGPPPGYSGAPRRPMPLPPQTGNNFNSYSGGPSYSYSGAPSFSGPTPYPSIPSQPIKQEPTVISNPAVISQPKVVYSAPPVRNKPKIRKTGTADDDKESKPQVDTVVKTEESSKLTGGIEIKKEIGANIELNVPVEKMETEHKVKSEIPGEKILGIPVALLGMSGSTLGALGTMPGTSAEMSAEAAKKEKKEKDKKRKYVRMAAGAAWEDPTLGEWDPDDFRIFCGDLGNEVTDDTLARAFGRYSSFQKARVIRDKRTNKTKGFGFVSLKDPNDFVRAIREMNGKYVGNRPIKLRKSTWQDRQIDIVKKKEKEKKRLGFK